MSAPRTSDDAVGVAIFVKTPGRSPVKTRLAAGLGRERAEALHLACATSVAAVVRATRGLAGHFAVAEAQAKADWPGLPVMPQGEGGLGERLARVHAALIAQYGAALLLGADAPQLTPRLLGIARDWLRDDEPRLVFGPAADGGFWTFGSNRPLPTALWTGIGYSRADTGDALLRAVAGHGELLRLPRLRDLDEASDLTPLRAAMIALESRTPEQHLVQELINDALAGRSP